ncbi:MAG: type IV secretion system DNA-binding domain-containing protein [Acidobacteriota bacterium]|nr:type IV secretion system DNA-binding domain-containing protein [Acidobacteriota bacterium]
MSSQDNFSSRNKTEETVLFARTNFRDEQRLFGIKPRDRRSHLYLIGKTGTGKSTLLETLMRHDITARNGFTLLDPHGDLIERIKEFIPEERAGDVIDFDVPYAKQPYGFNPLSGIPVSKRPLAASGMLSVFKHLWNDSWGPRLEHILRNSLLTLLDQKDAVLGDILRLLHDAKFRKEAVSKVENEEVRKFWTDEYNKYPERLRAEAIAPLQNKVGAFITNPLLGRIFNHSEKPLQLRKIIDEGRILLVNLSKGKIGEDTALLLGSLLISRLGLAALTRTDIAQEDRLDHYLYLDEFHSFTTLSLASMLSELRKYRINLILAHQYLNQLDPAIRDAVLGNVGSIIAFRVGAADAELLSQEFAPEISATDLTNLPNYHIYLKMMIDGAVSKPFSAVTIDPNSLSDSIPEFDDTS